MGKLKEFSITFTSPQVVYYPGQQVAGYVTVDLNQPMEMRGIELELNGTGYCHWTERHTTGSGKNRRTHTRSYSGVEILVSSKQVLCGDMSNKFSAPAGRQMFQFSFTLPSLLPSSFESRTGHIRYMVKAKIDKPWKFDHKVKRPFTVNDIIDTNNPMYVQPVGGDAHRDVGCLCCKAGPVDMSASIDRKCYCPGEAILVTTNVQNQTTRDMQNVHAKLIQIISYHATNKTKTVRLEHGRLMGPPIPQGEEAKWFNQPFGVPALPPSITNSRVITVQYQVEVCVAVPCGIDAVVNMQILLGTVPFMQSYGQAVQYETQYDPSSAPPQANFVGGTAYPPPQTSAFGYPDMAPPSYSAAVGEQGVNIAGEEDQHTYGNMSYNPVYTFAQPYKGSYQNQPQMYPPPLAEAQQYPPPDPNAPPPVMESKPYPPLDANAQPQYPPPDANAQPQYPPPDANAQLQYPPPPASADPSAPPPVE